MKKKYAALVTTSSGHRHSTLDHVVRFNGRDEMTDWVRRNASDTFTLIEYVTLRVDVNISVNIDET